MNAKYFKEFLKQPFHIPVTPEEREIGMRNFAKGFLMGWEARGEEVKELIASMKKCQSMAGAPSPENACLNIILELKEALSKYSKSIGEENRCSHGVWNADYCYQCESIGESK